MSLDDVLRKLGDLKRQAEAWDGEHNVPIEELCDDEFMLRNTEFPSIPDMFEASGFKIESAEDFAAVPEEQWNDFVANRTRFATWGDMLSAAGREWTKRKLGLD